MYILNYDEKTRESKGFYIEGIHKRIPSTNILYVDDQLWQYLTDLDRFRLKSTVDVNTHYVYNINDKDLFVAIPLNFTNEQLEVEIIRDQNAQLFLDNMEKEMRITDLEEKVNTLLQGGK